jgi:hypothetical protein
MIERFLELLVQATAQIPAHYFQLPAAGGGETIYRERVYTYELYHQLRTLLQTEHRLARYALSGEIDKRGHPIIRPCAPDLVFHHPGQMDNLVVVEVKPVNGTSRGTRKDLTNLAYFTSPNVHYQIGVELVYGDDERAFSRFKRRFRELDPQRFKLLWHRRIGEPAAFENISPA